MYYKGIIIDIHNKYLIVMDENGEFLKIKIKESIGIGQVILFTDDDILTDKKVNKIIKIWSVPLATAALIFISIISSIININNKISPYALLTFDINPSFSIEVDKDNTVINVTALNADAKSLDINKIKNKSLNEALKVIKTNLKENKKFEDKNSIIVGFSFLEENENIEFEDNVKAVINENFNDFNIVYIQGDKGDNDEAKKGNISLGKYAINKKLNNRFSEEQIKNITIDELIDILNEENFNLKENDDVSEDNEIDQDDKMDDNDEIENKENDNEYDENKRKEQDNNSKNVNSDLNDDNYEDDDKYENKQDDYKNQQEGNDEEDYSDDLNDSDDD